jgi:integrase
MNHSATRDSRVFRKGRWYFIDLRHRQGGRVVLRDPADPKSGARTDDEETAKEWAKVYDNRWREEEDRKLARRTGTHRTIRGAMDSLLDHRALHNEPSTVSGCRTAVTHLVEKVGDFRSPASVTTADLQELCNWFLARDYKSTSVRNTMYHLSAFFRHAGVVPNPMDGVQIPDEVMANVKPWNKEQCDLLREAADAIDSERADSTRFTRRLVEFLLATGARIQEAAAAEWEAIDTENRTIYIDKQMARVGAEVSLPKYGILRTTAVLPAWWDFHDAGASGLVFARPTGAPIAYRQLYDHVVAVLERAGLKKEGEAAHQFRHTYAFHFLSGGGSIHELSKCLGHKNTRTTEKYYDRFTSDHAARSAVAKFYEGSIKRGPRKRKKGG